ncbi:MAG: hypothetical protein ACE5PT_08730, partial [Gemmatimonadales bacterium]
MSDRIARRRRWPHLFFCLTVVTAGSARAQSTVGYREKVEQLAERWREATARAARAESLRGGEAMDTVYVGPMRVLARRGEGAFAADAASIVWNRLGPALGPDSLGLRAMTVLAWENDVPSGDWDRTVGVSYYRRLGESELASRMLIEIERRLFDDLPAEYSDWVVAGVLDSLSPRRLAGLYTELATTPAPAGRECFNGSLEGCGAYLGLEGDYDRVISWYSPRTRRALASRARWLLRQEQPQLSARDLTSCVEAKMDDACIRLIRALDLHPGRAPASLSARASLIRAAVDLGGPGTLGRMLDGDDSTMVGRLESSTGLPVDSVLAAWRNMVLGGEPQDPAVSRSSGWVAVFWVLVF